MFLGLGLMLSPRRRVAIGPPPENIQLSASTVAEDASLGHVVGTLSATADGPIAFTLADDAGGMFGVVGDNLILEGVLDFETATSHGVVVRAAAGGSYADAPFTITVLDVAETPGDIGGDDGEVVVDDPNNFDTPPVVVDVDDGIKFNGKKKSNGSTGKFIFDIGAPLPGYKFTLLYDPDFHLLGNGGASAMVGFGLKQANDFRISGLKGNGSTGLKAYEISGDNKWNQTTGFTNTDGGLAQHGTQAGPNWLQFEVSADGATYTQRTSADGLTWHDEFTDVVPAPFGDVTDAGQFGIAVFFDSNDAGAFSVLISLWRSGAQRFIMLSSGHSLYDVNETNSREVALHAADVVLAGG